MTLWYISVAWNASRITKSLGGSSSVGLFSCICAAAGVPKDFSAPLLPGSSPRRTQSEVVDTVRHTSPSLFHYKFLVLFGIYLWTIYSTLYLGGVNMCAAFLKSDIKVYYAFEMLLVANGEVNG